MHKPRKLIWFSHFIPFPPRGGAPQRSFNLLRNVAQDNEVTLVAFNMHAADPGQLEECRREFSRYCARVEFWEPPFRWRSTEWWWRLALSPALPAPYSCYSLWSLSHERRWQQLLQEVQPTLVHVDSIVLALYFSGPQSCPHVLTHHNCESAMMLRRAELHPNPLARLYLHNQARKFVRLEREMCHRFPVNVVVSEQDGQGLVSQDSRMHVHVVENGTDTEYLTPVSGQEEPDSLVFAGNLRWYPNVSGLEFFVDRVWPLLKPQRPGLRLTLAGREASDSFVRWASRDPAITVVPDPADIRPWVARGWVFICPILDGGGTRLKILDALAMGKAVVSTTIGCEGLRVDPGKNILVADSPSGFAAEVLRVLGSAELRQQLGAAGRALVEQQYDWRAVSHQLRRSYDCALAPQRCGGSPSAVKAEAR